MTRPAARGLLGSWKLALMALVVALVSLGSGHDSMKDAFASNNGTADFKIEAISNGVPIKDGCNSLGSDLKCIVHPGGTFNVRFYLDGFPAGLPDGGDPDLVGGYQAAALRLDYSPNLTFKPASVAWMLPGCQPLDVSVPGVVYIGCINSNPNAYTTVGLLATMNFNCPNFKTKETITATYGFEGTNVFKGQTNQFDTILLDEANSAAVTEAPPNDTIVVNCDNPLPADVTGDGFVSGADFFAVLQKFGTCKPGLVC